MNINKWNTLFLSIICLAISIGCRKIDVQKPIGDSKTISTERFFNSRTSSDPYIISMTNWVKRQNIKYNFVEALCKQAGFPIWEKSLKFSGSRASHRSSDEGETDVVHIPFVRDSQNYVNAILMIKTKEGDTSFQLMYDFEYEDYGYADVPDTVWNARSVFQLFTALDKQVFGTTTFKILDDSLIHSDVSTMISTAGVAFDTVHVIYDIMQINTSGRSSVSSTEICTNFGVCLAYGPQSGGCLEKSNRLTVFGSCCVSYVELTSCTTFWFPDPESGGGGGGREGGGEGGGGGNWLPPPPPCGPGSRNPRPCQAGWISLGEPIGSIYPGPLSDSTIAANLKKIYQKGGTLPDSCHTAAQIDSLERAYTWLKVGTDTVVTWVELGDKNSSRPRESWDAIAYGHIHPLDNQCFNGLDIYKMYKNHVLDKRPANIYYVTTDDYIYAAIITDKTLFGNFIRTLCGSSSIYIIEPTLHNLHIGGMDACVSCTWQKKTESGIFDITANNNSAISGIKIFKSSRGTVNFNLLTL